jgi:hypothetical protein
MPQTEDSSSYHFTKLNSVSQVGKHITNKSPSIASSKMKRHLNSGNSLEEPNMTAVFGFTSHPQVMSRVDLAVIILVGVPVTDLAVIPNLTRQAMLFAIWHVLCDWLL